MGTGQPLAYSLKPEEMAAWDDPDPLKRATGRAKLREEVRRFAVIWRVGRIQLLTPTGGPLELVKAEPETVIHEA